MRDTATVIGELLEAIDAAREGCRDKTFDDFAASRLPRLAVERAIEIISEASRHLPDDLLARNPGIPWPKIKAVGNVLRHEYYRVAPKIVWAVVQSELSALEAALLQEQARLAKHA